MSPLAAHRGGNFSSIGKAKAPPSGDAPGGIIRSALGRVLAGE